MLIKKLMFKKMEVSVIHSKDEWNIIIAFFNSLVFCGILNPKKRGKSSKHYNPSLFLFRYLIGIWDLTSLKGRNHYNI